ncbi:MAG TPA: hypothetical protein VND66_03610 [Acidobacteriaceae bacterium]|nr:hypothetical protein [Acidobacteriaceae bacterium]
MSKTDPPETYEQYFWRTVLPLNKNPDLTLEQMHEEYDEFYKPLWKEDEQEKADYRKLLDREEREHNQKVERLKVEIERQKERIRRDEARKRERDEREAQRKKEQEAERERRDPTPVIHSSTSPTPIPANVRDQHIFIPGKTRHGKSTQILQLVMRDIANGKGVAVLDPKGHLIKDICGLLPENRITDCIYLDLEHPVPLEIMRSVSNPEFLVGDLKQMVLKGNTTLERAGPMLTRLIYALLKVPNTSFTDIEDIFTIPKRKTQILDELKTIDPTRWAYWTNNWPKPDEYKPLTARMTDFTENDSLRTILGGGGLNISQAMNDKRIILVDLGGIGEPREIYGALLVSQFQQAAFKRTKLDPSDIIPYHLFVDEFEDFQTSSFAQILSKAGGLGLRLTVGNQYIDQLTPEIRHAIFGNVGTYIIFHIEEQLSLFTNIVHPYNVNHLARLPQYQAVYRVAGTQPVFKWTADKPAIDKHRAESIAVRLKAATSAEFGQKRTVDNYACNIPPVPHDESNEHQDKGEPEPGASPSHERRETRKP